eukprot:Clim_evm9s139 gene=Clim_evmTU9s139
MSDRKDPVTEPLPDYYQILQVPRDAELRVIKQSFHRLARANHPDRNDQLGVTVHTASKEETMAKLNEAWNVLNDDKSRRYYDAILHSQEIRRLCPVWDHIKLNAMEFDDADDVYFVECRCGGEYILEANDVRESRENHDRLKAKDIFANVLAEVIAVQCNTCSLAIDISIQPSL